MHVLQTFFGLPHPAVNEAHQNAIKTVKGAIDEGGPALRFVSPAAK
jgi:hypothetical protein